MTQEQRRENNRVYCARWRAAHPERAREISREYSRAYRARHPEKEREYQFRYYHTHVAQSKARDRRWEAANREKVRAQKRALYRKDVQASRAANAEKMRRYRLKHPVELFMRNSVAKMFRYAKAAKASRSHRFVGCTPLFLRNYLESQFKPGMAWANYGAVWQIDHIIPLAWWDVEHRPENLMRACHYSNLQPMFKAENLAKGARYVA